jgi:methylglutaconyl-CoA hydratase
MKTVRVENKGPVTSILLNRPDCRNALDESLLSELTRAFGSLPPSTRVVVLTGAGSAFCAGADLHWMKRTEQENSLADLLRLVDESPRPVLARVNGPALGGGVGLIAVCDIAIAAESAQFGFTEVRLGLVPAIISTYVLPRIGAGAARRYFLTGERFGTREALAMGLIHEAAPADRLDERVNAMVGELLQGGPAAMAAAKKLIRNGARLPRDQAIKQAIRMISALRVSPEGQEGMNAFLEKRKPHWP